MKVKRGGTPGVNTMRYWKMRVNSRKRAVTPGKQKDKRCQRDIRATLFCGARSYKRSDYSQLVKDVIRKGGMDMSRVWERAGFKVD